MHAAFGLELTFCFDLAPGEYHTNVVMSVLAGRALVIAPDGFADAAVAQAIARALRAARARDRCGAESRLRRQLHRAQRRYGLDECAGRRVTRCAERSMLESWGFRIEAVDLAEIEKAGGSLRCCVGGDFLTCVFRRGFSQQNLTKIYKSPGVRQRWQRARRLAVRERFGFRRNSIRAIETRAPSLKDERMHFSTGPILRRLLVLA